ncbi:MAG: response regulator [Limisphaerales bacterium]|jgi:DNA-binding NtrC family response regulator
MTKSTELKPDHRLPVFEPSVGTVPDVRLPFGCPHGNGEHILFVDQEPLANLCRNVLERFGYRASHCTSSARALALLQEQPDLFDLVIAEMNMCGPDVAGFARRLFEIRPGARVIMTTSFNSSLTLSRLHEMGITELLQKPYDIRSLAESVHRTLDRRSSPA